MAIVPYYNYYTAVGDLSVSEAFSTIRFNLRKITNKTVYMYIQNEKSGGAIK